MKTYRPLLVVACAGLLGACAAVPKELVDARDAYRRASTGPAVRAAPAEVHVAHEALARAEQSFQDSKGSFQTRDLAYVAQRKAQLAEATASIVMERESQATSKSDYQATQGKIIAQGKEDLSQARKDLVTAEHTSEMSAQQLASEQRARKAADQRAADAQAALAELAAVRQDERGLVITLSGSVLFASNRTNLLPEARSRLGKVVEVLLTNRERNVTIEGHTDSQGSESHNLDLSQRRADAVRDFFVERGYESSRIRAQGFGESRPVADNNSAEGRANNRRVEIIVERGTYSSR